MADKWGEVCAAVSRMPPKDLKNVCHLIADSFCQDGIIASDKFLDTWSLEEWWDVRGAILAVMKRAVKKSLTKDKIFEELAPLDESYKNVIAETIVVHRPSLVKKLMQEAVAVSHAVLSDFDWKLQLAMASDKVATLQQPYLQLDFDVKEASGERKQIALELDQAELASLISSLESCSKSVQQLTVKS